ncbi:hypothetical protein NDU88_001403 [Pleurodeles waltl]|uniref:Uncharacterized protein n=1 Tax=Pleurodeles waltl TaxID=8319 RepID=A0AAV7KSR6_PLEWA|nr:hypothetical protein NDU88_001403 [Pleurodeles waltl]
MLNGVPVPASLSAGEYQEYLMCRLTKLRASRFCCLASMLSYSKNGLNMRNLDRQLAARNGGICIVKAVSHGRAVLLERVFLLKLLFLVQKVCGEKMEELEKLDAEVMAPCWSKL